MNKYTQDLIDLGYFVKCDKDHYQLYDYNFHICIKVYAMTNHLPYTFTTFDTHRYKHDQVYLSEEGIKWIKERIYYYESKDMLNIIYTPLATLRVCNESDLFDIDCKMIRNLKGLIGPKFKRCEHPSKIVWTHNNNVEEFEFDNVDEARDYLRYLIALHPIEEFKLYTYYYRESRGLWDKNEVPLFRVRAKSKESIYK